LIILDVPTLKACLPAPSGRQTGGVVPVPAGPVPSCHSTQPSLPTAGPARRALPLVSCS